MLLNQLRRGAEVVTSWARRIRAAATGGYRGAANSRTLAGFFSSSGRETIDSLLSGSGDELRARVRIEVRENAHAGSIVETWQSEMIACGITPHCLHPDPNKAKLANEIFSRFSDQCDPAGQSDFYAMQGLVARAMVTDGESFARKRYRRESDGLAVPLQIQLLEGDHVPFSKNDLVAGAPGSYVINGVEFNAIGKRQAYWMYRHHPGQRILWGNSPLDLLRIPAQQVLHVYRPIRPGQVRGETWLARCLQDLHVIKQYTDAELMRKKFAAYLMGFIKQVSGNQVIPSTVNNPTTGETAPAGAEFARLESGTLNVLGDNEDIQINRPAETDPGYEAFLKSQLKAVAKGALITYHQLTGDLREVNFSSIRADVISHQRMVEMIAENTVVFQFCRPIWIEVMDQAALAGQLDTRDYLANREFYLRCDWRLQRWQWLDPESDLKAAVGRIRSGLSSRTGEVAQLGYDAAEVDRQNAEDQERSDALGLQYDSDGRRAANGGGQASESMPSRRQQQKNTTQQEQRIQ